MRKVFIGLSVVLVSLTIILGGCAELNSPIDSKQSSNMKNTTVQVVQPTPVYKRSETISSPAAAEQLLLEGNQRFISGKTLSKDFSSTRRSDLLMNGQHPFAVIMSCSDSRVPPELLFDQALGDLFVIRVAGNVIAPVELGSVEYAVEHLKVPLVVVLGHEECGAVTAAVQGGEVSGSIADITKKIKPSVNRAESLGLTGKDLIEKSIDLNIENTLQDIAESSIIKEGMETNKVKIIGAKYDLDEGAVKLIND